MKIALVIEQIDTRRGGQETSATEFAQLLAQRGHDLHLITAAPADIGLPAHAIGPTTGLRALRPAAFARRATEFLAREKFDVVHAISPLPTADIYQPRGGSMAETIQQNIALRDSAPARAAKRFTSAINPKFRSLLNLERDICHADGPIIAAVSQYVADQFHRYYGLIPPRVRVIFNGVNVHPATPEQRAAHRTTIRQQHTIAPNALLLLCVAHNFKLKGVPRLLDALAILHRAGRTNVTALIVGRDNQTPILQQARQLGIEPALRFAGSVADILPYLHAADLCVHPTSYDPASRIVLEALAHGLPAITTRQNGSAEVIEDGVQGFVIDSFRDVTALADRIQRLSGPAQRAAAARAAELLAPRLAMSRHVNEMIAIYDERIAVKR